MSSNKLYLCSNKTKINKKCKFLTKKKMKTQTKDDNIDVIIIGAGASGLSASRNLIDKNFKIIILESRNRIGGRIYDADIKNFGKIPIGAAWLHKKGKYNLLKPLMDDLSIKYMNTDSLVNGKSMNIYRENGEKLNSKEFNLFTKILSELPKKLHNYGKNSSESISDATKNILKKYNLPKDIINSLITRATEHCSLDSNIMPVSEFDGWEPNGKVVVDGYQKLIDHLSRGLDIRLNSIVKTIKQTETGVLVKTKNGTFHAKYVICTLPVGVLQSKSVKFIPSLPKRKIKAIKNMFTGSHEKIFLLFDKVFWDPNVYAFQYSDSKNRGLCTQWFNITLSTSGKKILYTNLSGPDIKYLAKSDKELTKICMKNLKKIFGTNIPNPKDVYVSRWAQDPYTMGGPHSHPKMNGKITDHDIIGEPFKKIYFAGVDTSSTVTETVEAALLSGIRASNQIMSKFNH